MSSRHAHRRARAIWTAWLTKRLASKTDDFFYLMIADHGTYTGLEQIEITAAIKALLQKDVKRLTT